MADDNDYILGDEFDDEYGDGYPGDNDYIHQILDDLGRTWDDIIVDFGSDNDPEHYRPGEYTDPEDALIDYYERGLGDYIEIYYDPETDSYEVYVAYEEGA